MNAPRASTRALVLLLALAAQAAIAQTGLQPGGQTASSTAVQPAGPYKDATSAAPRPKRRSRTPTTPPAFNPALVLLDPAHGGNDSGGQIAPDLPEKQVTLDFARRLRTLLQGKGFTVVLTRESDPVAQAAPPPDPNANPDDPDAKPAPPPPPPAQITTDQRAELANRLHPVACILIHATSSGHGVHLYTSALTPPLASDPVREVLLWDTAQGPAMVNSAKLTTGLSEAINGLRIPLVTGQASIRPIDSMTCPAVALEFAPLTPNGGATTPVTDAAYQQRLAEAVATALTFWRGQAQNILDEQAAFAAREAERAAALGAPKKSEAAPATRPVRPKAAPGSLIPNAPAPLPKIPQIPKITTPKTSVPNPGGRP